MGTAPLSSLRVGILKMAAANLSSWLLIKDPLTLLTMVEVVLDRCQHIIGFSPEAQVSIGEVVLLCKEIRETLIDLTVENRLSQSYLRLLHFLLSGLGETISAAGQMNLPTGKHWDLGE